MRFEIASFQRTRLTNRPPPAVAEGGLFFVRLERDARTQAARPRLDHRFVYRLAHRFVHRFVHGFVQSLIARSRARCLLSHGLATTSSSERNVQVVVEH